MATRRRALAKSGSQVELHEDSIRRVVQCRCGASERFRGPEEMWAKGWGSHFVKGTRVWQCADCWSPTKLREQPSYRVDPVMLEVAARPICKARNRLERQIVRLLEQDPPRGRAYLDAILEHVHNIFGRSADRWRALRELVAGGVVAGRKRPKPTAPREPRPERRRIAGELASRVIAVRLTPTEEKAGEAMAKGVSLGLWFRRLVQLAQAGELVLDPGDRVGLSADPTLRGSARWLVDLLDCIPLRPAVARAAADLRARLEGAAPAAPSWHEIVDGLVVGNELGELEVLALAVRRALTKVKGRQRGGEDAAPPSGPRARRLPATTADARRVSGASRPVRRRPT